MNERVTAVVTGRVQMVMYRDFASRAGRMLALTGEVKNLKDGTVQVIAEGTRAKLEAFCTRLKQGSLFSKVENVACTWGPATGEYASFDISYE